MMSEEVEAWLKQELPTVLSVRELSTFLRVDEYTIRREIWEGHLPAFFSVGTWNIRRRELIEYLSDRSSL